MKTIQISCCVRCPFCKRIPYKKSDIWGIYICTLFGGKEIEFLYGISSFCQLPEKSQVARHYDYMERGNGKRFGDRMIWEVR